jgi:hypothetical protein
MVLICFSVLTLSLAAGAFKFHPYSGMPFKEYKPKTQGVKIQFLQQCK